MYITEITCINQTQIDKTGFHVGIVLIVLLETLPVCPGVLPTDGDWPQQKCREVSCIDHHDRMKGLTANSRIMLCNREQDMSRQQRFGGSLVLK